jgi:hypothetical protein
MVDGGFTVSVSARRVVGNGRRDPHGRTITWEESGMILGMSTATFTELHVVISLIGIVTGFVSVYGLLINHALRGWTNWFLATTVLTSATGFLFRSESIGPPHIVGAVSLVILAVALYALYGPGLSGRWRATFIVTAVAALYLNVFVGVVQAFLKLPFLHDFAPTGKEPPFVAAQLIALVAFIAIGIGAVRRYHPSPATDRVA